MMQPTKVLIMGAAGRDFHNFNVVFRDDPKYEVIAFTAAQIPFIDQRRYPSVLAGALYPEGVPIYPEQELESLIERHQIRQVVFAYYAGVDYERVLRRAESEAEVLVWDGGNNDYPFFESDLEIVLVDPLRAGRGCDYFPGPVNLARADVVVLTKLDTANESQVEAARQRIRADNPDAPLIESDMPISVDRPGAIRGRRVLVIEDGPTLTHGGMSFGAGTLAAQREGAAECVDPRPYAVGSLRETFARWPHLGPVWPAMGYRPEQVHELELTIRRTPCDLVVVGTPVDLRRLIRIDQPACRATYEFRDRGKTTLQTVLQPVIRKARAGAA